MLDRDGAGQRGGQEHRQPGACWIPDFSHLPQIVNEGRRVINNIQRTASLFLVKTTFSVILSLLTLFFIPVYPFEPIQLTLISTVSIGMPSFFLALEPNHERVQGNFLRQRVPQRICPARSAWC